LNNNLNCLCFRCNQLQLSASISSAKLFSTVTNKILSVLDISNNNIGIDGVKSIALALHENILLLDLALDNNENIDEGIQCLS
jgi:hypothetical protein